MVKIAFMKIVRSYGGSYGDDFEQAILIPGVEFIEVDDEIAKKLLKAPIRDDYVAVLQPSQVDVMSIISSQIALAEKLEKEQAKREAARKKAEATRKAADAVKTQERKRKQIEKLKKELEELKN